jgi:hypothetical protein
LEKSGPCSGKNGFSENPVTVKQSVTMFITYGPSTDPVTVTTAARARPHDAG